MPAQLRACATMNLDWNQRHNLSDMSRVQFVGDVTFLCTQSFLVVKNSRSLFHPCLRGLVVIWKLEVSWCVARTTRKTLPICWELDWIPSYVVVDLLEFVLNPSHWKEDSRKREGLIHFDFIYVSLIKSLMFFRSRRPEHLVYRRIRRRQDGKYEESDSIFSLRRSIKA